MWGSQGHEGAHWCLVRLWEGDISGIWQREELHRRGWDTSHTRVVCNFPAAALVLCPEISGLSPFRSRIQSTWGFPTWFHSDKPALESRGHRETCRNQQQLCWMAVTLRAPVSPSLHPALGSRSQQQSEKRAQSTKTPDRCCTAVQHALL